MIEVVLIVCIVSAASFYAGIFYREWVAKKRLKDYISALSYLEEEIKKNTVSITITKEDDSFLVHREDNGEFLAQGKTHAEIKGILESRFPYITFVALPSHMKNIGYKTDDTL